MLNRVGTVREQGEAAHQILDPPDHAGTVHEQGEASHQTLNPSAACPTIAALLDAYGETVEDDQRQELVRYAAEARATHGGYELQEHRARFALAWARSRSAAGRRRFRRGRGAPTVPDNPSPVEVAEFVVGSLGKHPNGRARAAMLLLLEWLIAMRSPAEVTPPARWGRGRLDRAATISR